MKNDSPSQTAVWILKGLLYLIKRKVTFKETPQPTKDFLDACIREVDKTWIILLNFKLYQWWFGLVEKLSIPGIFIHYFFKKKNY